MRLTITEISNIKKVFSKYSPNAEIYLHGSRIDDDKKGGDIDLFFVVEDGEFEQLSKISYKIQAQLSLALNEQKVDLLIISKAQNNEFYLNSKKLLIK